MEKQKVTVTGYVEKSRVLKVVRRSGRKAELWPFPYDNEYHPYASQYLEESNFMSSHNYYVHGYNNGVHGYFPIFPTKPSMITSPIVLVTIMFMHVLLCNFYCIF
ncbi:Heavy metal-associated isoprenylated plant protein 45 [Sesamum alatum]|uniref:Heavy metal-associated isoprenylated plant protein 45 n=1 Tax=Sesamum alatum TaxID=300844 RepID=A0AAE2C8K8_9LAMI|nr:Heavy metal-associated isoprenylated plant protein 45 [Sesamum alatum]